MTTPSGDTYAAGRPRSMPPPDGAPPASPVEKRLDALAESLDRLEQVEGSVPGRLVGVLGPDERPLDETALDVSAVFPGSPVVRRLAECSARVAACTRDLAAVLERVEV